MYYWATNNLFQIGSCCMKHRIFAFLPLITILFILFIRFPALAQGDSTPLPTPPAELSGADAEAGMAIYQARCASCHGATGLGDGELAAQAISPPLPIGTADYLATADLDTMRQTILNGNMQVGMPPFGPGTSNPLSDEDITNVLAALYDLVPLNAPIPEVILRGRIANGTTGETVNQPTTVELAAFTSAFEQTISISTTVDATGRFTFTLEDVSPSWAFITSVVYAGVDFSGDVFQFSPQSPEQETIVTVFDPTSDSSDVVVDRWHMVADMRDGVLQMVDVFVFVNQGTAVYMGETGDPLDGTLRIPLPAAAESPSFQRGFGGLDSFLPANEFIPLGSDWVDTMPLRPGASGMIILAQYTLPYDEEITLERSISYALGEVSIVVPEGMEVDTADNWEGGEVQSMGDQGSFVSYLHAAAEPGDTITLRLSGEPNVVVSSTGATGTSAVVRNESNELFIGVVALLVVGGGAFYAYRTWQKSHPAEEEEPEWDKESLLQAIADLDDAYESGELSEGEYQTERQRLKLLLLDVWEQ